MSLINAQSQVIDLLVNDYKLRAHSYGFGKKAILLLGNGPSTPCDYFLQPHQWLTDMGYRVISFEQTPTVMPEAYDNDFNNYINTYLKHIEIVRETFGIDEIQLMAHGWGNIFALEYALRHPEHLCCLTLINPSADIAASQQNILPLRHALGEETALMMQRFEALNRYQHPEYQAATELLKYRHICRLDDWPDMLQNAYTKSKDAALHQQLFGPHAFYLSGIAANWKCLDRLKDIQMPTLILAGMHGIFSSTCAKRIHDAIQHSQIDILKNCSQTPFYEQPEYYFDIVIDFLNNHRKTVVQLRSVG